VTDTATGAAAPHLATPPEEITEAAILDFAREFDPQPYHLDRDAAEKSIFGGLCASGWQICSLMTARLVEALGERGAAAEQECVRELRFRRPVFCGDRIRVEASLEALDGDRVLADTRVLKDDGSEVISAQIVFRGVHLQEAHGHA
jgi:acyl dehydratase